MRVEFANAIIKHHASRADQVFITGDLGYMALEQVRTTYGDHFINAGVAEQNMITVAAAMAHEGFLPWVYSISPFTTLRPYEQIRNDVCHHKLPVKIVGNGGGYGYGIMGGTHHNLEDIAILRILPNMKVYVPFVASDVEDCVADMVNDPHPAYLRLNMAANCPYPLAPFQPWRRVKDGGKLLVVGTGPVLGNILALAPELTEHIEVWVLSQFPAPEMPDELKARIAAIRNVLTVEEHAGQCGMNELLARMILANNLGPLKYNSLYAQGYISGRYGDQKWHQQENGMYGPPLEETIKTLLA